LENKCGHNGLKIGVKILQTSGLVHDKTISTNNEPKQAASQAHSSFLHHLSLKWVVSCEILPLYDWLMMFTGVGSSLSFLSQ